MEMVKASYEAIGLINQATSTDDVVRVFTSHCTELGFPTVNIGEIDARIGIPGHQRQFSNMPHDYLEYRKAQNTSLHDPGLILARQTARPFTWAHAHDLADQKGRRVVDECCANTHAEGLSFPIHSPAFASGFASLGADQVPDDPRIIGMISVVASTAYARMVDFFTSEASKVEIRLSPRERDVLYAASYGLTNKEIARSLKISPDTVKQYMSTAQRKLDARDRAMAVAQAIRQRLLPN
ncbi:MAG: LuxR C-terminal-related transcriptional regulator [Pseudomonadota bacterium]